MKTKILSKKEKNKLYIEHRKHHNRWLEIDKKHDKIKENRLIIIKHLNDIKENGKVDFTFKLNSMTDNSLINYILKEDINDTNQYIAKLFINKLNLYAKLSKDYNFQVKYNGQGFDFEERIVKIHLCKELDKNEK